VPKLLVEIPFSSGNIRKLKLRTDRDSRYCSIESIQLHNNKLVLIGCDALSEAMEAFYFKTREYIRFPPTFGRGIKNFEYALRVTNYRQLKPAQTSFLIDSEGLPISQLKIEGVSLADTRYLKGQLRDFVTFMTGWAPRY